ncbi:MAG: radical SAM protein [Anaerolineales bacterium]|jgi:MoaA/NifB/PqqE/SkfB family radical SAM enzyme
MIELTGLHLLLTMRCIFNCDHCFVWGSPDQQDVFTLKQIREIYKQARSLGTVEWIYLEGGEPFLYYPILREAAREAAERGFKVGIVTNGYWAVSKQDALDWLEPLAGAIQDLSVSTDLFHYDELISPHSRHALAAAHELDIPMGTIVCEHPDRQRMRDKQQAGEPVEGGAIMFRGRAAVKLGPDYAETKWDEFHECPHERLDDPGRVHIDPTGEVHLCQGISMGNLFDQPLDDLIADYEPHSHPIVAPLLEAGPSGLVNTYKLEHEARYADACHLCYAARTQLRDQFPMVLGPDSMYGVGIS